MADAAENDVPAAKALLSGHGDRWRLHVPPLFFFEVGNILACGRMRPEPDVARQALAQFFKLGLVTVPLGHAPAARAFDLSRELAVSFYDASTLALAESLGCDFVTADARFARKAAGTGHVRLLADRIT